MDEEPTLKSYNVPDLGDAGDWAHGIKDQKNIRDSFRSNRHNEMISHETKCLGFIIDRLARIRLTAFYYDPACIN